MTNSSQALNEVIRSRNDQITSDEMIGLMVLGDNDLPVDVRDELSICSRIAKHKASQGRSMFGSCEWRV